MYYLLFLFYLLLACYFVSRSSFVKSTGLSIQIIIPLFLVKVVAGLVLAIIVQKYTTNGNDYWNNNALGIEEYELLIKDPVRFLTSIFDNPYENYGHFFGSENSYWNDLQLNLLLKLIAVLNIFTRGNYYVNIIFFSLMGFYGSVALYRVFFHIYKEKKWPIIIGCFLLPSTIYFTAGIHKDSIVFLLLGLFSYCLYFNVIEYLKVRRTIVLLLSFVLIALFRGYLAVLLLPAALTFIICSRYKLRPLLTFITVYGTGILILFAGEFIIPSFQPLKVITEKQAAFFSLPDAKTTFQKDTIAPTVLDLATHTPQAFSHSVIHPYILEYPSFLYNAVAIEMTFYLLLFLWIIIALAKKSQFQSSPFTCFAVFFAISALLLIGFIVPYPGAIIRYRSLFFPFVITPLLAVLRPKTKYINKINI